ncbi:MAG: DNA methylase [bacterium]
MAKSQSHQLGEFIGSFFEDLMKKPIREFADKNGLYFDTNCSRKARGNRKTLTWTDVHANKHRLDFVLEKGGTESAFGEPIAFIELAWRNYTKHSKNKAQEISGAVNPISEKYEMVKPFKGAILSGVFTDGSLNQLKSEGFHVLYIPSKKMVQAFSVHGLDIDYDEGTSKAELKRKYIAISKKTNKTILEKVRQEILKTCDTEIKQFVSELSASYNRKIKTICILPLHGKRTEVLDVEKAIDFISGYESLPEDHQLEYIEVIVTYNNGTIIHCQFKEKDEAVDFLEKIK